jgi:hypothetical protein
MSSAMLGAGEGDARLVPKERKATTVAMANCILIYSLDDGEVGN